MHYWRHGGDFLADGNELIYLEKGPSWAIFLKTILEFAAAHFPRRQMSSFRVTADDGENFFLPPVFCNTRWLFGYYVVAPIIRRIDQKIKTETVRISAARYRKFVS